MREYEEITLKIAERIFEKGDEIIEERRKRSAMIKKLSISVSGLCAAVIAGFAVWNNENLKNAVHHDDIPVITESSQPTKHENRTETAVSETTESKAETSVSTTKKNTTTTTSVIKTTSAEKAVINTETTAVSISNANTETENITTKTSSTYQTAVTNQTNATTSTVSNTATNTDSELNTTATQTVSATSTQNVNSSSINTGASAVTTIHTNATIPDDNTSNTYTSITTTYTTTSITTTQPVTSLYADYKQYGRLIKRLSYLSNADDSLILLDEDSVQHYVKVQSTEALSADEIIGIIGDTSFCDNNVFSCSGKYQGEISNEVLFFDIEHYAYVPESETIYSAKMRIYCVRLEDDSKAYVIKLPQSDDYYLYTLSEGNAEDIYWRERKKE